MGIEAAKFKSAEYYIVDKGNGFAVYQQRPVQVFEISINHQGVQRKQLSYQDMFGTEPSIFDAESLGHGQWDIDAFAGAQRWRGTQSTSQVKDALWKCGFHEADVIIQIYRKKR